MRMAEGGQFGEGTKWCRTGKRLLRQIWLRRRSLLLARGLSRRLRDLAPGLTARAVLEKFAAVQMLDVHLPTTDGRTVILTRYTQPEDDLRLLLERLKLELPSQPPTANRGPERRRRQSRCSADFLNRFAENEALMTRKRANPPSRVKASGF